MSRGFTCQCCCVSGGSAGFLAFGVSSINGNGDITFPNVVLNLGDGYNSTTGVFTCPKRGIYSLWVTLGNPPVVPDVSNFNFLNLLNVTKCDLLGTPDNESNFVLLYTFFTTSTVSLTFPLDVGFMLRIGNCNYPQQIEGSYYTHFSAMYISSLSHEFAEFGKGKKSPPGQNV